MEIPLCIQNIQIAGEVPCPEKTVNQPLPCRFSIFLGAPWTTLRVFLLSFFACAPKGGEIISQNFPYVYGEFLWWSTWEWFHDCSKNYQINIWGIEKMGLHWSYSLPFPNLLSSMGQFLGAEEPSPTTNDQNSSLNRDDTKEPPQNAGTDLTYHVNDLLKSTTYNLKFSNSLVSSLVYELYINCFVD